MPRWLNILIQSLATAGQIANVYGGLLPDEHKVAVGTVLGIGQIVVSSIASHYNPDGTKAEAPYIPPVKKVQP